MSKCTHVCPEHPARPERPRTHNVKTKSGTLLACIWFHQPSINLGVGSIWKCPTCGREWQWTGKSWHWPPKETEGD